MPSEQFFSHIMAKQVTCGWDDDYDDDIHFARFVGFL